MSITRVSLYRHELEVAAMLTEKLVRVALEKGDDIAVAELGPEIFGKLVAALYGRDFPMLLDEKLTFTPGFQADGKPWDHRPGAANRVNL